MFIIISKNHKVLAQIPKLLQKGWYKTGNFGFNADLRFMLLMLVSIFVLVVRTL